ncbi:MAG: hypothetical protein M3451_12605, partial [Chloroflexota bacterium]|nr:hypothetical protein [Chloroflexota bacterium]
AEAGDSAAQYWAGKHVESGNPLYAAAGMLASLWTPDTALETTITLGGGAIGRPLGAVASFAGDAMVASRILGPTGRVFGNTFYAGRQGFANHGHVRLGWSFNKKTEKLEFAFRIGKDHLSLFERVAP